MIEFKSHLQHADTLFRLLRHAKSRPEELRRFQDSKLRFLVASTYHRVPLYRSKFDAAGTRPEDIRGLDDLRLIPLTCKDEMRAADFSTQTASGTRRKDVFLRYTAGSTGEPAHIYRTAFEDHLLNQFRLRASRLLGECVGEVAVALLSPPGPTEAVSGRAMRALKTLLPGKRIVLNCLRAPDVIAEELIQLQPDIVRGLPGILAEIAALWPRSDPRVRNPRLLLTSGELLTPNLRHTIEAGFGAPVRNMYLCHEFNLLAWECPETSLMHVCDDSVIVEVLRDSSPVAEDEEGDVVVTGLHSYTAPFLRYGLGDTAVRGPDRCPCGAPFSTLKSIKGRQIDICVTPDGRKIHHWELIPMSFWDMPWFRRYQVVQKTPAHVVLRVIPNGEPPAEDLRKLEKGVLEKLGPTGSFDIEFVDEIAFANSGKHQSCRSEVGSESV
ncbi:MAG: hypothetical protein PVJ33_01390 [Lysobacterales bacterium]|jgi:phenylacetate-CoA ligase